MSDSIPLDAIDPDHVRRTWIREFEWHLDVLPALMDAIISQTLPLLPVSRGGSQFDRPQVTGGGYYDNVGAMLPSLDLSKDADGFGQSAAVRDATELWGYVVELVKLAPRYVNAHRHQLEHEKGPHIAEADLEPLQVAEKPNADPLIARMQCISIGGWLIDLTPELEPTAVGWQADLDDMFALIRRLRGRYGVIPRPRPMLARCAICGEKTVEPTYIDNPNGSPHPIRGARCKNKACGQTYHTPIQQAGAHPMSTTTNPADPALGHGTDKEPTEQNKVYLVLSEQERAQGFARPVRRVYIHTACGTATRMSTPIAETYARDPKFYGSTWCTGCHMHLPVVEFTWDGTTEKVGS